MAANVRPRSEPPPLPGTLVVKLDTGRLQPFRQGELDGLCGLYGAINAIRLALLPIRRIKRTEAAALFATGLELLNNAGNLPQVLAAGMGPQQSLDLLSDLAVVASKTAGVRIEVVQPLAYAIRATRARMFEKIDEAIGRGQPVLISMTGVHDHLTVIAGVSPSSLWLFDSGDLQMLRRSYCGTQQGSDKWRHRISARALIVLEVTRKRRAG